MIIKEIDILAEGEWRVQMKKLEGLEQGFEYNSENEIDQDSTDEGERGADEAKEG